MGGGLVCWFICLSDGWFGSGWLADLLVKGVVGGKVACWLVDLLMGWFCWLVEWLVAYRMVCRFVRT